LLFTQLVRAHSPRLHAHVRRFAVTEADAHDLLQEVWLRAYRKRRTFEGRGSLFGWLLMVARTVGLAELSKRSRQPITKELDDVAAPGDPDAALLRDRLRDAVLTLTGRQREVVLLRIVEGLSTAETAQLLECAEGTVKATLHQAVRKLQELLRETVR
jgi:RNA polymerase sigma-70 factor, ECF subfamily